MLDHVRSDFSGSHIGLALQVGNFKDIFLLTFFIC
jgi:hypothetical protein